MSSTTTAVTFDIAACDRERAANFLSIVAETREQTKGEATFGRFKTAFEARLTFRALTCSPFTFLSENNTRVMGYEDPGHAQHVSRLYGWPVENLAYIRVELSPEAFQKLEDAGAIKNVSKVDKKIWSIDPFAMFALEEPEAKFSVKTPAEVGL
jgi:hypothetical protein